MLPFTVPENSLLHSQDQSLPACQIIDCVLYHHTAVYCVLPVLEPRLLSHLPVGAVLVLATKSVPSEAFEVNADCLGCRSEVLPLQRAIVRGLAAVVTKNVVLWATKRRPLTVIPEPAHHQPEWNRPTGACGLCYIHIAPVVPGAYKEAACREQKILSNVHFLVREVHHFPAQTQQFANTKRAADREFNEQPYVIRQNIQSSPDLLVPEQSSPPSGFLPSDAHPIHRIAALNVLPIVCLSENSMKQILEIGSLPPAHSLYILAV